MSFDPNYAPISGSFITTADLVVSTSGSAPVGGFRGLYIGVAGSVPVVGLDNSTAVFNCPAGTTLWIAGRYVDQSGAVGTITASSIVGLR